VTTPSFQLDSLLALAERHNPALRSLRAREHAADVDVTSAKTEYLPTLALRAGWSGFTHQYTNEDVVLGESLANARAQATVRSALSLGGEEPNCDARFGLADGGGALLGPVSRQIQDQNSVFPFRFTEQPFRANLVVSLPIFTGFSRSLRLSQARAQQEDADEEVRARRLTVRSDVHARHLALETAYRAIGVQASSREAARDQLRLAQDRYKVGVGTALEVSDAQNAVQQAEGDYVTAVYDYHKAIAALEAAVGRSLR
jgi:outer membrane protein TolC